MKITGVHAREILDSRGNPTVEADVLLENGTLARAAVPSGASTGTLEACELRDGDPKRFGGKGVLNAVRNVNEEIANAVVGMNVEDQAAIDGKMIALDGTQNKSRLGANAILAVSLASARVAAAARAIPLYRYIGALSKSPREPLLPLPQCNIINGGAHTNWESTDIQEFMIAPVGAPNFREGLRMVAEIFHALKKVLASNGYGTTVGDEGGFAPKVKNGNAEAFELITQAIEAAGYRPGDDIVFTPDVAASEFFVDGSYKLAREGKDLTSHEMIEWLSRLADAYPIRSIEDGLAENDWNGWKAQTEKLGASLQLVGDDLLVTNTSILERAIREKSANAILIKPNQIGTLTETIAAVDMAHAAGWRAVVSHRSGETEDTFISHLAVGLATGQMKTGSMSRGERVAKYNELLRIEEQLGDMAQFAGNVFN